MAEPISIQQLKDASLDVKSLEEVVNGDEDVVVTTRLGETYPSVKGSIKKVFETGGLPAAPFATKALMTASSLADGQYAMITNDTSNNGLYVKTAGAWVKSSYDPVLQANAYADDAIMPIKETVNGIHIYKSMVGRTELISDSLGVLRVSKTSAKTGDMVSYAKTTASSKSLVAGANITLNETDTTITINSTGGIEPPFVEPTEFVLCLIAGQSNATYYGGDALLAPALPNLVCRVWDAGTLRDINDGSSASSICKRSFAPALALEFYKRTGMGLIVVNAAVGSTAQVAAADNTSGNWDATGTLRGAAVAQFNACKSYLDTTAICYQKGFIAWAQGERDGQEIQASTITKSQYKSALITMIDYFKTELGTKLPFIIVTTAYYTTSGDNTGSKAVRAAQREVASEKAGAFLGYTGTTNFPSRGLMSDSVHYNQQGKNILGTALGKVSAVLSTGVN